MTNLLQAQPFTVTVVNVRAGGDIREAVVRTSHEGLARLVGEHPTLDDHGTFSLAMNDESTGLGRNHRAEQLVQDELGLRLPEGDHFLGNVLILGPVVDGAATDVAGHLLRHAACKECDDPIADSDVHAGSGMCGSCVHNALRSGWEPPGY